MYDNLSIHLNSDFFLFFLLPNGGMKMMHYTAYHEEVWF